MIYQFITSFRWDRDWPTSFQVAVGVIEGALMWVLILTKKLPGISMTPLFIVFLVQYGLIWLSIFALVQGPLRVIWLKWRYQGGQWFVSQSAPVGELTYQQQPAPQFAGGYNSQPPPPPQVAGGNIPQQAVTPPQIVRSSNPDHRQRPGDLAGLQPVQSYTCACGFTFDRGNFCPRCGRPKVQQGGC